MHLTLSARPLALILSAACLGSAGAASAGKVITVAWRDKPPYHYLDNGQAKGFLLQRTHEVFAAAGIEAHYVNEPLKRIWANFQHGATDYCSISWYRLPEREAVTQYTQAIHIDPPHVILVAPDAAAKVRSHATLAALMADPGLTLAVVDGVSYGVEIDNLIKHSGNQVMRRTVEPKLMLRMLTVGRASFMFADRDDWDFFRKNEKWPRPPVRVDFPDMPPGLKRHIVCSKDVAPEIMEKLNQAIAATGGPSNGALAGDIGTRSKHK
jgi:polar amino acid transport system substrate-binding protein